MDSGWMQNCHSQSFEKKKKIPLSKYRTFYSVYVCVKFRQVIVIVPTGTIRK